MTDRLTVLITNIWLQDRAGSETVVRDLALGLLRRGHRPIVYSPALGAVADEIAARGIAVVDDLRKIAEQPDILHAHHSVTCGEALIHFANLPAIQVCHAFAHWLEAPVHFPQIGAYVAVDEACRDRLVHAEGVAPEGVIVIPNAVDLRRVPARAVPLHSRPLRALAFGKASAVPEIRVACEKLGIDYTAIGLQAGNALAEPERELVKADLVFASARAALEALCCGCAVVACDERGMAGMVTSQNYESLRARNFGLRSLSDAMTTERCIEEASRYDAHDASLVCDMARRDADLEPSLDQFEQLYRQVLSGSRRPSFDTGLHAQAVTRFLHDYLPRRVGDPRWPWIGELVKGLESARDEAAASNAELARQLADNQIRARDDEVARYQLQSQLDQTSRALADLKKSRLLRVGRLLRRLTGRPAPY